MDAFGTFFYFTIWGIFYGFVLGFISGTLIVPVVGSVIAAAWGSGVGFVLGMVIGILTAIIKAGVRFRDEADYRFFRRSTSIVMGTLSAIFAPLLILLTAGALLWYPDYRTYDSQLSPISVPVVIAAVIWGWLACAHATSRAVDLSHTATQKRSTALPVSTGNINYWVTKLLTKNWLYFLISMGIGAVTYLDVAGNRAPLEVAPLEAIIIFILGFVAGGILFRIAGFILAVSNGLLIQFLNRVLFYEYLPHLSREDYRRALMVIAFVFTLFTGVVVSALIFAPLMALAAARVASEYADETWQNEPELAQTYDFLDDPFIPVEEDTRPRIRVHKA